MILTFESLL